LDGKGGDAAPGFLRGGRQINRDKPADVPGRQKRGKGLVLGVTITR